MYKTEAIGKASKDAPLEKIMIGREGMKIETFSNSDCFLTEPSRALQPSGFPHIGLFVVQVISL